MSGRTVVVLGGGIVGLACAYEALGRGWRAIVIDAGPIGGQASSAAAGMLAPYSENGEAPDAFFQLCRRSFASYPAWVQDIEETSRRRVGFVRSGSLHVARREADRLPLLGRLRWQTDQGARLEWVEAEALPRLEPALAPGQAGALYCPEEAHVQAPLLVQALAEAVLRRGGRLVPSAGRLLTLERAGESGGGVRVEFANAGTFAGDRLCCCLGSWSEELEPRIGLRLPVHPIRGQICAYAPRPVELRHIVFSPLAYWVPKPDGSLVCGASEDEAGFDRSVTPGGIGRLARAGERLLPGLQGAAPSRSWAGLRPATLDGRPLIGAVPGRDGMYLACGHYRNGILLSPATAAAFGRWLDDEEASGGEESASGGGTYADMSAFRPDRFGAGTHACREGAAL
ncbi:glycine oxidase ThiO [Paenibacillus antri]|uniref:glycine oxidase n=1 Tax=Paenibacillus antri TaxID=2582848 RepID=A0A5R9GEX6_9BACL|nr:glycine oxidase ThiO [Paenibacillus antri]TLS51918.1 glycine oxidase ThiO [Paenibacillus antri]